MKTAFVLATVFLILAPVPTRGTIDSLLLQKILENDLSNFQGSVLVLRPADGTVLAAIRTDEFYKPYPQGSLIKVFTAVGYYTQHGDSFPELICPASLSSDREGCWDRNGHGRIGIVRAIAHSCNVYFRQLAGQIDPEIFANTLKRYQLIEEPSEFLTLPEGTQRKFMVGATHDLAIEPLRMLRAYCAVFNGGLLFDLVHHSAISSRPEVSSVLLPQPAYQMIRNGMGLSSAEGTSIEARKKAGVPVLGKTGTTLKWDQGNIDWKQTQGWWIGFHPPANPEVAVMVFAKKGRGATDAAPIGGRVIAGYVRLTQGE